MPVRTVIVPLLTVATAAAAHAQDVEVIYTEIAGDPSAQIPGGGGLEFTGMLTLNHSPSGGHWIFKGFADADSDQNDVIIVGAGATGTLVARESMPAPEGTFGFMDSDCGINDAGHYVFGNRLQGVPTDEDEVLIRHDGQMLSIAVREGDLAPDLFDPGTAGDETYGNTLNSAHISADDSVAFHADLIQNVPTEYRSALYIGADAVAQEGTSLENFVGGDVYGGFVTLSGNTFSSSSDGSAWIVEADLDPDIIGNIQAVVVTENVEIREGDALPEVNGTVDDVFAVQMSGNGSWFARGGTDADVEWAVKDGTVVAVTFDPIVTGSSERWSNASSSATFSTITGNDAGRLLLIGGTDELDPDRDTVMVLDGETVLAREGDPIDLDGNGVFDDDVFIRSFSANDAVISLANEVLFFATLRDAVGTNLGDAFLRILLGGAAGDVNGDGVADVEDLLAILADWGPCRDCMSDLTGDDVVDVNDLLLVLANWTI